MKPVELKVARIGNSRGVRLPAATLERYRIGDTVVMEERSDGILLRPRGRTGQKLSWEETAEAMAASGEQWADWESAAADGLDDAPWETRRPSASRSRRRSIRKRGRRNEIASDEALRGSLDRARSGQRLGDGEDPPRRDREPRRVERSADNGGHLPADQPVASYLADSPGRANRGVGMLKSRSIKSGR